ELYCFFFSSRRRHTRSKRDWSSDVCSSDLDTVTDLRQFRDPCDPHINMGNLVPGCKIDSSCLRKPEDRLEYLHRPGRGGAVDPEIGRASCRERGEIREVAGA